MTRQKAIDANCKDCIYDPLAAGTWRQQVALCSVCTCPLRPYRPMPTGTIPDSVYAYYSVSTAERRAIEAEIKGGSKR